MSELVLTPKYQRAVRKTITRRSNYMHRQMRLVIGISVLAIAVCVMLCVFYCTQMYHYHLQSVEQINLSHGYEIEEVAQGYNDQIQLLESQLAEKASEIETLQAQLAEIQTEKEQDAEYVFSIAKKFDYVIEEAPVDGGVTIDLLVYTDERCKEYNINPHLLWAIVDIESSYQAVIDNAHSSARGLGQFLESTARTFYEKYLQYGTYDHSYAYDPYISIDLIVEYLSYLQTNYHDTKTMVRFYSGRSDDVYYSWVKSEMSPHGFDAAVNTYM